MGRGAAPARARGVRCINHCSKVCYLVEFAVVAPSGPAAHEHTACTLSFLPCVTHFPRSTCSVEFTAPVQLASLNHVAFTKVDVHVAKR